ncbi:pathogenesis-related protein 1A-like [Silene latifolia]|uniref:pathogenesis-related protein 1A-like n=1 Tax=Silene latifolia TaxID=37657 RepID=UPI003D777A60
MNIFKSYKIYLFSCFIIVSFAHVQISHAQNSPQDYVNSHNYARFAVGVEPLYWDNQIAAYAEQYANERIGDCALQSSGSPYGENIAIGSGDFMTGEAAVQMWVDQQSNYDYGTNTCVQGNKCGMYTQVVWRNSVHLGCARVQCYNGSFFVICYYDPPGNFYGEKPF